MKRDVTGNGRMFLGVVVAAVASVCIGCGGGGEEASTPPPPVERSAKQFAKAGAESVIVYVADRDREYTAAAGNRQPTADQRFRIGSLTKTFTAAVVLQLVAEGKLRLGDTLERYVPGLDRGAKITIRQLLQHRSGLANFTDYAGWLEQASRSDSTRPIDTLRFAAAKPLVFEPGSQWGYSNTNYIALGLVVEKVTGSSYGDELAKRILEPLELESVELPTTRRLSDLDDGGENPAIPWAAGGLVANARDVARFYSALLSGEVLSDDMLSEMKRTVPVEPGELAGGLGIYAADLPCGRFWGHEGGILDYATLAAASEDGTRVAVLAFHGGRLAGPAPRPDALLCPPGRR